MKAAFCAEAIGLGNEDPLELLMRRNGWLRIPSERPWVAEITGRDSKYGLARVFVAPKHDYRQANGRGTRGVWFWWTLESGRIYETHYRETWNGGFTRKFIRVTTAGEIEGVRREEVERWLNEASWSTS